MKKNFESANTSPVYGQIASATAEDTAPEAKKPAKKKNTRVNAEFSEENYDFLKAVSRASGISMTDFLNKIVDEYVQQKRGLYEDIQKWRNSL